MTKRIVVFITFVALTILGFIQTTNFISWIQISYKVISLTASIVMFINIIWIKWLWYYPAKWRWTCVIDLPIVKGKYNVVIESSAGNYPAEVTIKQNANEIKIFLESKTGLSSSTTVGIIRDQYKYIIEYFYYLKPMDGRLVLTNPAHDGSAKIIVVNNKIISWEYWTNRNTKGVINII